MLATVNDVNAPAGAQRYQSDSRNEGPDLAVAATKSCTLQPSRSRPVTTRWPSSVPPSTARPTRRGERTAAASSRSRSASTSRAASASARTASSSSAAACSRRPEAPTSSSRGWCPTDTALAGPLRYTSSMSDAAERKRRRAADWSSQVFRGPGTLDALDADAETEWAKLTPAQRLALTWSLSLEQYGGADGTTMEPRLPRSAYRVERR